MRLIVFFLLHFFSGMPLREQARSERIKWAVVMFEFAPICIYLVISLLVFLILRGFGSMGLRISLLFITLVLFFYWLCETLEIGSYFVWLLSKVGLHFWVRVLCQLCIKLGFGGGLTFALGFKSISK